MNLTGKLGGILFMSMLVTVPLTAFAKEVTIGKLTYKVNTTDKIAKCTGLAEESTKNYNLTIPSTVVYNGITLKVTTVEKDAFWFDNYLKKVTLSDYTETIGSHAFADCDNLSIVSLGKKLKIIGKEAFAHSGNTGTFTTLNLPSTVETIRESAFMDCRYLVNITMGDKVQTIGDHAFWNCESLKTIVLPGSLTSLGEKAFSSCSELYEVTFKSGSSNTVIGVNCFNYDRKLTLLNFYGPGVAEIKDGAFTGCHIEWLYLPPSVHTIGNAAFSSNNLTLIELSEGLKNIGPYAFEGQYGAGVGLRTINIPSTVTTIGKKAFYEIGNLDQVVCNASTPPSAGEDAFDSYALRYCHLVVPPASLSLYRQAPIWKEFWYVNDDHSGIKEINGPAPECPDADEIWYDLNGNCVDSHRLTPGLYLRRRGSKTDKVIIK